ncbi:hypothetical protein evm_013603 [Chilo suppressalis]|nr:hypothetical protein evm_013603 [Chilo suppressalis]
MEDTEKVRRALLAGQTRHRYVRADAHHHQPINVPTAGAQAFPTDGIGRLDHDPPRGPSADWRVLTTADAAGTNGLTCLPKHGGARDHRLIRARNFIHKLFTVTVIPTGAVKGNAHFVWDFGLTYEELDGASGFVPGGAAVPVGGYQTSYAAQPQRRGLGTGAAVGMGVGALAAGGLAGYALGGGFSSNNDTSEMVYGGSDIPANMEELSLEQPTTDNDYLEDTTNEEKLEHGDNEIVANSEEENAEEQPTEDDDYLKDTENQEVEQGEKEVVANTEEENAEEQPTEDDDYLENTENQDVDERENEIPAYTEEEAAPAEDDDYLENDDE